MKPTKLSYLVYISLLFFFFINSNAGSENYEVKTELGKFTEESLNLILKYSSNFNSPEKKIGYLSYQFMDTPYEESTLIGNAVTEEKLTINLKGVDCFTYLDYVEALRLSDTYFDFKKNLVSVRYQNGSVEYSTRNHFFSDWREFNKNVVDVTNLIGKEKTITTIKNLNEKKNGTLYLEKIPVTKRKISFIPSESVDKKIIKLLKTGDYIGIYSEKDGLDVSHTGIVIKKSDKAFIRHASSRKNNRRVVDEDLLSYIKNKPGILIFRPSF